MKVIVPVVDQDEARTSFMKMNRNNKRVRQIDEMHFFHRPFWLARTDFVGKVRLTSVEGTIVALADARIFRLGIIGIWKYRLDNHLDLGDNGVDFRVAEVKLDDPEHEEPLHGKERVIRELNGFPVKKTMSKGLSITGVAFVATLVDLVYRPYWNILYTIGGQQEQAFLSADSVLLTKN